MSVAAKVAAIYAAGAQPWPVKHNGTKAPRLGGWSVEELPERLTEAETLEMFETSDTGLGVLCGKVSGNLELFEFEGRFVNSDGYNEFLSRCQDEGLGELLAKLQAGYEAVSPTGGIHLMFRTEGPALGNTHLARRPSTPEELAYKPDMTTQVLIETRGEGGFAVFMGSNGKVHPSGGAWRRKDGGPTTIATITIEERAALYELASSFDEMPEVQPHLGLPGGGGDDDSDLVEYIINEIGVAVLLTEDGFHSPFTKRNGRTEWTRPGKESRGGGSLEQFPDGGCNVYTTTHNEAWSAAMLTGSAFNHVTPIGVLAAVRFDGDIGAAMSWTRKQITSAAEATQSLEAATPPGVEIEEGQSVVDVIRSHWRTSEELRDRPHPAPLVDKMLFRNSLAWLIGAPGAGKSFLAIDLAMKVGMGGGVIAGNKVQGGRVLYIIAEGVDGIGIREQAWHIEHDTVGKTPNIVWQDIAVSLYDPTWSGGLADAIGEEADAGDPFDLIVIDTLARSSEGAEENSATDTASIIKHADTLRRRSGGATVLLVHHTGKDASAGGRGSTAFKGAVDSEITLTGSTKTTITVSVTKQKNVDELKPFGLVAKKIGLGGGIGADGDEMTSLVLLDPAAGEVDVAEDLNDETTLGERVRIGRVLRYLGSPSTKYLIRNKLDEDQFGGLGMGQDKLNKRLAGMMQHGLVEETKGDKGQSMFSLTPSGFQSTSW